MKINKNAFSFVELIVSVIIIAIVSTIWFVSYTSFLSDSRDSQRKSDLSQISSALKVYKQTRWYYAMPWEFFNVTYYWEPVVYQWFFDTNVRISSLDRLPMDPRTKWPYTYSTTKNAQEFELSATLENQDKPIAIVNWTYKSVSINILPSILLAIERDSWENAEIVEWEVNSWWNWSENRNKFIFDQQSYNIPYSFIDWKPKSDWTELSEIMTYLEENNLYWQNTDFRNCLEIEESWKNIQNDWSGMEYQIVDEFWILINTYCYFWSLPM